MKKATEATPIDLDELRDLRSRAQVCAEKAIEGAARAADGRHLLPTGRGWFIDVQTGEVRGTPSQDVELMVELHPDKALEQVKELVRVGESQLVRAASMLRATAADRGMHVQTCFSALWRAIDARGLVGLLISDAEAELDLKQAIEQRCGVEVDEALWTKVEKVVRAGLWPGHPNALYNMAKLGGIEAREELDQLFARAGGAA